MIVFLTSFTGNLNLTVRVGTGQIKLEIEKGLCGSISELQKQRHDLFRPLFLEGAFFIFHNH